MNGLSEMQIAAVQKLHGTFKMVGEYLTYWYSISVSDMYCECDEIVDKKAWCL